MKRFRFRLKRLERLRDIRRQQARALVAQALGQVRGREQDREQIERELSESLSVDPPESGPLDPAAGKALAEWHDGLRRGLRHAAAAERLARQLAREASDRLALASREHRVLERLRERQRARWENDAELEDRKFLDEIHRAARQRQVAGGSDA